ncbi:MAG: LPS-assembly protein LptD [Deltaproteobacteria bacterium]|nr:LPS-assembly protein LptD [Deltaproteobacteria bacterium]
MKRPGWVLAACLAAAGLILAWVQPAPAQEGREVSVVPGQPWRLKAERLNYEDKGNVIEAHGRVVLTQANDKVTAEHLRLNRTTKNVEAWDNVAWHHHGDVLKAKRLKFNLENKMGKAFQGSVFITGNHFYLSGREIDKTGDKTYVIRDCTLTTCDGTSPDWFVRATKMKVSIDGYGHLWAPRFYMGKVPLLFFPYAFLPIKTKRESGFLIPTIIQSSRDGFAFDLPYYWAWADWAETTFFLHHSAQRGQGLGAEVNFMLGQTRDRGLFYFDYLNDKEAQKQFDLGENKTNTKNRYWLRGIARADKLLPLGVSLNLMIDKPSDPDFIREFDYWTTGLPDLNRRFRRFFGQTLRDSTEEERLNRLQLRKSWTGSSLTMDFRYKYNPLPDETEELIQYLPHLSYNFSDRSIKNSNFYYNFSFNALNAWRPEGERGQELSGTVNLYSLLDLGP